MTVVVRAGRADDGPVLQQIELLAGERFREIGMRSVADDEPFELSALAAYAEAGRSWVAIDEHDDVIGYAVVDVVDDQAHLEQISVRPDQQGRGVGRALIDQIRTWALVGGRSRLTLTTFRDVPWNGPLYAHLGFVEIAAADVGPELARVQADEAAHGLDPATRIAMALGL